MSRTPDSRIADLRLGGRGAPRHVSSRTPAITWRTETQTENWTQARAVIELRRTDGGLSRVELDGPESAFVPWPFDPLEAYEVAHLRVGVVGSDGAEIGPSEWIDVEAGPLGPDDWTAAFIAAPGDESDSAPAPLTVATGDSASDVRADLAAPHADRRVSRFRRELTIDRAVARATLSYTARGVVDFRIDDVPVSDEQLAPGWTSYGSRLLFSTVDVTAALGEGPHVLGAWVAPGWFGEHFGFDGDFRRTWHGKRALSAQLPIRATG